MKINWTLIWQEFDALASEDEGDWVSFTAQARSLLKQKQGVFLFQKWNGRRLESRHA